LQFQNKEFKLKKGDLIYLLTDGIIDQNNPDRRRYSIERLISLINKHVKLDVELQKQEISADLDKFINQEKQRDDITLIGIKI